MKLDDIVPVLVMVAYVALLVFKRRKLKGAAAEKDAAPKKTSGQALRMPGLFSKLGERLKAFFSELEHQFKIEAEKARMKNREPDRPQVLFDSPDDQGIFDDPDEAGDFVWEEAPDIPTVARVKQAVPGRQIRKHRKKSCRWGADVRPSRQKIRNAVVWSEILAPPLALRGEKKPWEI